MKSVVQNLRNGDTTLADVPCPEPRAGEVLIASSLSLISAGTERMIVEFGRSNPVQKALQQPEKVKQVLEKVRTDGLKSTVDAVKAKLDAPTPVGYCNVGIVVSVGPGVSSFKPGDRVVSNGPHAEMVCVPVNLVARIPDDVPDDTAVFTVLGAIALQGIRLAKPTLGECFAVYGLGLVGLLTVQLLKANGCRVLAIDFNPQRLELARSMGAEVCDLQTHPEPVSSAISFSRDRGVDGVILTVATSSDDPIRYSAQMCRKLGRVILVGVTGLNLSRDDFFKKEISFQVSASYGPGRYDPEYEQRGHDYPLGYVRWTENRNFEAVLDAMAAGALLTSGLVSHRFRLEACDKAYGLILSGEPSLGVLLEYDNAQPLGVKTETTKFISTSRESDVSGANQFGFIGAGNFAGAVLLPAFKKAGIVVHTIVSAGGINSWHHGRKFKSSRSSTSARETIESKDISTVVISTRHDTHFSLVKESIASGKNIFVEKPLCLHAEELEEISESLQKHPNPPLLMVGFNRRFAPLVEKLKRSLEKLHEPKSMVMTVNAGHIPADHWTQDPLEGGGRVIGECCHFIDLLRFLTGSEICRSEISTMQSSVPDTVTISLTFADGSIGTIHYFANGNKTVPKERLEVYCAKKIFTLNNYKSLTISENGKVRATKSWRQDKGHERCAAVFSQAVITGGESPISFDEIYEVHTHAIRLQQIAYAVQ
ncbi:bi-domain-containing oxidoreductase [Luminiphilus sp.]|nr:bi-domain-containing oxidoreductase [Luminiphilus sp.]